MEGAEASPRALAPGIGHQPEADDPLRQPVLRHQRGDQQFEIRCAILGRDNEVGFPRLRETVARAQPDHLVPGIAQLRAHAGRQSGLVCQDQPTFRRCLRTAIGAQFDVWGRKPPGRAPCPALRFRDGQRCVVGRGIGRVGRCRFDEVTLALEHIARQRHPAATLAPDRRPVQRQPGGRKPRERVQEEGVILDRVVGMAQGADHPVGCCAIGLRQGRHGAAGADLDEQARGILAQRGDAAREIDMVAQVIDPIARVGGLSVRHPGAGAVRQDRDAWRGQRDAAQEGLEFRQDRFQHPRMGGDVDRHALTVDAARDQRRLQRVDPVAGAGHHRQAGGVVAGQIQVVARLGHQLCRGQRHAEHAPRRDAVEQASAQFHQRDAILEPDHPRQAGGSVLAHRMTGQRLRDDTPADPQLRQRVFDDHDQRQLDRRAVQRLGRGLFLARLGQPQRPGVAVGQAFQHGKAAVHPVAEDRLGLIQAARHVDRLRAAAGEQEGGLGRRRHPVVVEDPAGVAGLQQLGRLGRIGGDQHAALVEQLAPLLQGEPHIGQVGVGMGAQPRRQRRRVGIQRGAGATRHDQRLDRPVGGFRGRGRGRLLDHDMRVCAAHAKRVHRRPARAVRVRRPRFARGDDVEGGRVKIDHRVRRLVSQAGRDFAVMQRQGDLDQAGCTGGGVGMADIRLDRADAGPTAPLAQGKGLGQGRNLDRVAQAGARSVAFDVVDGRGVDARDQMRLGHGGRLPLDRGGQIAGLGRTVVVDRAAPDHRPDVVAVNDRVRQAAQQHDRRAAAEDGALAAVIEGAAMTVRRQDFIRFVDISPTLRQLDRDAAGKRRVAIARQQRLACRMDRHQRGGTGRLHGYAWPAQVEDVADPGGQEILVVAGMAQQEHARFLDQVAVRADVDGKVAAHPAARPDPDHAQAVGPVPGMVQRMPAGLQELAVLGVHHRGILGAEAEELGIEMIEPVQPGGKGDVIGMADP